jgi:sigma-B regulation protein RsbU (phosphoserine phosphatase)
MTCSSKLLDCGRSWAEAASYVRSLLPKPAHFPLHQIAIEWCFLPSQELGGDSFNYQWLDEDHLAIYLLDVSGHGVGSAPLVRRRW